jgi:integrase
MIGTITHYTKKNGRKSWGFVYDKGKDKNGKRKQITKQGFKSKSEAAEALRNELNACGLATEEKLAELTPKTTSQPARSTFGEVLDEVLAQATMGCTLGTVEAYRKQSRYPRRAFGEMPIDSIRTKQLQEFFTKLHTIGGDKSHPLSPKMLKHIRYVMKLVFDLAVRQGWIPGTPLTKDVRLPKLRKKRFKMPEKQRLKEVIEKARGRRLYPILKVGSDLGARLGEVLALLWTDYDSEKGTMEISKALEDTKHGVNVKGTKSEEARIVDLSPSTILALEEHRRQQQHDKDAMGSEYDDQGYIFCPPQGGYYRPSNVSTRVSTFLRKHGLELSMHGLRHAHGSILLSEGAPIQAVAERLGHANAAVTLQLYSHVIPSDRKRLALLWEDDHTPAEKSRVVEMLGSVRKKTAESA